MKVPGRTRSGVRKARRADVQVTTMSLCRTGARSAVGRTSSLSAADISCAIRSAARASVSQTCTRSSFLAAEIALSWMRPCTPAPQTVATLASARARWRAASVVAAPVRLMVTSIESITASGRPLVPSAR